KTRSSPSPGAGCPKAASSSLSPGCRPERRSRSSSPATAGCAPSISSSIPRSCPRAKSTHSPTLLPTPAASTRRGSANPSLPQRPHLAEERKNRAVLRLHGDLLPVGLVTDPHRERRQVGRVEDALHLGQLEPAHGLTVEREDLIPRLDLGAPRGR